MVAHNLSFSMRLDWFQFDEVVCKKFPLEVQTRSSSRLVSRFGQNHTYVGREITIRSYMVYIHGSGPPYLWHFFKYRIKRRGGCSLVSRKGRGLVWCQEPWFSVSWRLRIGVVSESLILSFPKRSRIAVVSGTLVFSFLEVADWCGVRKLDLKFPEKVADCCGVRKLGCCRKGTRLLQEGTRKLGCCRKEACCRKGTRLLQEGDKGKGP